ncbi:F-box/RNI-like superfamily protein [Thalictrum thalictroides]|uniref:F-box/RNI-like superfamily protein n=1 Tax=Thalictrum thalictroides TaxID=46969 RepID=A0A7J6WMQ9_THATH|nr:F-box/RNI-like superfamily protein [Thalictrum thalictroides]
MDEILKRKKPKLVDMNNNLPEEVMDEILKRMHIKDAAKTSVVSKQWRHRWASIPEIVFGSDQYTWGRYIKSNSDKIKVVTDVLLLHTGIISKFELNYLLDNNSYAINRWIVYLARRTSLYHLVIAFNVNRPSFF